MVFAAIASLDLVVTLGQTSVLRLVSFFTRSYESFVTAAKYDRHTFCLEVAVNVTRDQLLLPSKSARMSALGWMVAQSALPNPNQRVLSYSSQVMKVT